MYLDLYLSMHIFKYAYQQSGYYGKLFRHYRDQMAV